jgi:hypothetical protein
MRALLTGIIAVLCSTSALFAATVRLYNDSPFPLRATIRGADGTYLGEMILNSFHGSAWTDTYGFGGNYGMGNITGKQSTSSQTPYNVTWHCLDGGNFSYSYAVPDAGTCNALGGDGPKTCKPSKQEEKQPYPNQPQQYLNPYGKPFEKAPPPGPAPQQQGGGGP